MKIDLNNRMHRRAMAEVYRRRIYSTIARQRGFIINPYAFGVAGGDPYFANVVSLLHFNGSDGSTTFTDQTGKTWTANATAQLETNATYQKFGSAVLLLTGANAYIHTPDHADWDFGSGSFTVEGWFRIGSAPGTSLYMLTKGASYQPFTIFLDTARKIYAWSSKDGSSWAVSLTSASAAFAIDAWQHVAYVRDVTDFYLFNNGSLLTSVGSISGALMTNASRVTIGADSGGALPFGGYVDDFRATKGIGRYTSAFTAPTAQFPDS